MNQYFEKLDNQIYDPLISKEIGRLDRGRDDKCDLEKASLEGGGNEANNDRPSSNIDKLAE